MTGLRAILFDTYGTLVDWRSSLLDELTAFGRRRGLAQDWPAFLTEWKACYRPGMEAVNRGESPWTTIETIYERRLVELLRGRATEASAEEIQTLVHGWWRLRPWPDSAAGLARLKTRYVISPLSNASFAGMVNLAKFAGLPWDCVITAENAHRYKPHPDVYRTALTLLGLDAAEVMLAAAHNYDLAAAQALGFRTAFVPRPFEYGPGQTTDLVAEGKWDVVVDSVEELAATLGC